MIRAFGVHCRQWSATLRSRVPAPSVPERAGYGYEILLLTSRQTDWPRSLLQWAVNAELMHDAGLLDRVERHEGLTVEEIAIGVGDPTDVLTYRQTAQWEHADTDRDPSPPTAIRTGPPHSLGNVGLRGTEGWRGEPPKTCAKIHDLASGEDRSICRHRRAASGGSRDMPPR